MENKIKKKPLFVKKPFTRVTAIGHGDKELDVIGNPSWETVRRDNLVLRKLTQEDFEREYDPLAHLIYNREYYPDIWRKNDEDGNWYVEEIPRYSFAFQKIILYKHMTHLCGNDIVFELADEKETEDTRTILNILKDGWRKHNCEIAWYNLMYSVKRTADGACVGYLVDGKFGWKSLSFKDGDVLYPHFDRMTGEMEVFARTYRAMDDDGEDRDFVDVWDKKYYYCLVSDNGKGEEMKGTAVEDSPLAKYDISGFTIIEQRPHGFPYVPIVYVRNDEGPCWSFSQELIDQYEMAFSRLAQANHDFGLPIMYIKGEGSSELTDVDMSYASKVITLPDEGEVGFLNRQDASNAYKAELSSLEDSIYRQSFAVRTPELKSGDTPAAAIKMLYSDAVENAINDSQKFQSSLTDFVKIFEFGYGVESKHRLDFQNTNIVFYIEPYVHRNVAAEILDMSSAVQNCYLSRQTASEKSYYSTSQEWDRILNEEQEKKQKELLLEAQRIEVQNDANVDMQEELADINAAQQIEIAQAQNDIEQGNDEEAVKRPVRRTGSVATGRGKGRPRTVNTDKWGNRTDGSENNWGRWNLSH